MRRLLTILMDVILLALLVGGLVAIWGLRSTNSQEDMPSIVRVSQGQVSIVDTAGKTVHKGGRILTLNVGQTIRVDTGADAFLFFGDGSVSRITGPAELILDQSRRTIRKPAILTSIRSKLFNKPSPPPAETKMSIKARALAGQIVTKAGTANSRNVSFEILGPGVVVVPTAASFAMTVPDQGDVAIEVGQGTVAVGMVSLQGEHAIPVVIPKLESRKGITVPLIPVDKSDASDVARMLEKVAAAIPELRAGAALTSSQGIDFRPVTDSEIMHFVGERLNGKPLVPAPPIASRDVANTRVIEESVIVPGVSTSTITDQTVADSIDSFFPGAAKVRILPGSVAQLEYRGMTYVISINVVDGRPSILGLPFGVDPPQIDNAFKTAIGTQELPALLSIVSTDGQASVSYAKDITVTELTRIAEEGPVPDSLPHTSPYFRSIPTPREISTDWKVVGSNALMALLITLAVVLLAKTASSAVAEHEDRFARFYTPFTRTAKGMWKGLSPIGRVLRWFSPGPLTRGVWMMFVFGAIYSFLAVGGGLLGPNGLTILLTLSFTSGFMALYVPWVKASAARRMKIDAKVGLFPWQLSIAAATVGISRAFAFKPGLMLGSPGGVKMSQKDLTDKQKFKLEIVTLVALAALGALAWLLVFFLPQIGIQPWAAGFFRTAKGFVSGLQDWSLVIFAVAVQAIFFGLLPLPKSFSLTLMKKHLVIWVIAFVIASFVFMHTQLNKEKSINDLMSNTYITLAVVAALAGLAVAYRRYQRRSGKKAPESTT